MWGLILAIVIVAIICFIINLVDKNKEKLIEKFKIEKKEIMKCPVCYKEYEDLKLKECSHCESYLEKETKYKFPKELKRKILHIIIGLVLIVLAAISGYIGISNVIQEKQRIEKYENDIKACYSAIKDELDWEKFKSIIQEHSEDKEFSLKAYEKLYQAIDERIENIKNGNNDDKLPIWLYNIQYDSLEMQNKFKERYLKAITYSNINAANKNIEEQKYKEAYDLLITIVASNKDKNQDIVDIATNKQNEIKDKAFEQVITQAQEKINNKEYSSAQTILSKYKDLGNQTILDMYNNATQEKEKKEAEEKAKEEAERIAKEKAEAEERARKEVEEKARKKSEGVRIGMSKQDVLDSSWGKPYDINTSTGSWGVHEQWVYGGGNYLYFENGILTSIQN